MSGINLRTFQVDVTPPLGMKVCGWHPPAIGAESPIKDAIDYVMRA